MRRLPFISGSSSSLRHSPVPSRQAFRGSATVSRATAASAAAIATSPAWLPSHSPLGRGQGRRDGAAARLDPSSGDVTSHSASAPERREQDALPEAATPPCSVRLPFKFETGIALFAKRTPRPFPPPFLSPPSGSFSDPLSTHDRSRDRRSSGYVNGALIRGFTNGDDAVFASDHFICANDGVGAWSQRPRGHAGLWARLVLHFWAAEICDGLSRLSSADAGSPEGRERNEGDGEYRPDPVACLQRAFDLTVAATSPPNDWQGTTTATGAQIHYRDGASDSGSSSPSSSNLSPAGAEEGPKPVPVLYVTNLGDSQVMVVRPSTGELVFKTQEQWHWFDCPRQLGTNSPDSPLQNAKLDVVEIREGDVVLAMSDGVIDNLWPHEIVDKVCESVRGWESGSGSGADGVMDFVAQEVMEAARVVAVDPFAESPFMEHAVEEGLPSEGGKLDDISVVAAVCRRDDR